MFQRPIGLNGLIGLKGRMSALFLGGVVSWTIRVVLIVWLEAVLPVLGLNGNFFFDISLLLTDLELDLESFRTVGVFPCGSTLTLEGLLLSLLETLRSSWLSTATLLRPSAVDGGSDANN